MTKSNLARWASLLVLTGIVASCGPAVTPTADAPAPAPAPTPAPTEPLATCGDLAIRLLGLGAGIHGAIVTDTLHMGGVEAPATCADPANLSLLAGLSIPDDYTAQVQQSQYYLITINYPHGNRLYVVTRRSDGTSCVVDTNDRCIAQVTELPDDFDLDDLPDDVAPTIPAGRPAPAAPDEPVAPGGGYTPPVVSPPPAEPPPAGPTQSAVAPAWSVGAQSVEWVVRPGPHTAVILEYPTGTPPIRITTSAIDVPGSPDWPWEITLIQTFAQDTPVIGTEIKDYRLFPRAGGVHLRRGQEGVITFIATNSAGTAKTTVSYAVPSCLGSDAAIADWLKGSAWEPIPDGIQYQVNVKDTGPWFRRAVFNDNGNGLTVTTLTGGTVRLTGGVRADYCSGIKATGWEFHWNFEEIGEEGKPFKCQPNNQPSKYWLYMKDGRYRATEALRPAGCSDNSP